MASLVARFLAFLVILVIGSIVVKTIDRIADTALERVGFDKAVERGGVGRGPGAHRSDSVGLVDNGPPPR